MPKYKLTKPDAREFTLARTFNAPRRLVFDAFTKPEMVKQWLWGPDEWPMVHCEIDLRVGGKLRYVWRHQTKGEMGMSGVFHAIKAPELLVNTELFDQDWTGGEALVTTTFEERRRPHRGFSHRTLLVAGGPRRRPQDSHARGMVAGP